jgi:ubiquinone/menaquinone biosynthesis C-methylase UbiE
MAERAHPDDPGFQDKWSFCLRRGFIPWIGIERSPYKAAFHWRYKWVSQYCNNKTVLDVPCGMGWGTSLIRGAKRITGVDISQEAVAEANRRYGNLATFKTGDMSKLDFEDDSFEVISCLEGIEHVPVEIGGKFLKESERLLRPGGILLLSSPFCRTMAHSGNPFHIHEYQPDEIKSAVSGRFSIEEIVSRNVDIMTVLYMRCRVKK